jgi:DNA repair exonuclease SbcCD ATPase subunit
MYVDIQHEINPFIRQHTENEQAKKQIDFELQSLRTQHEDMVANQAYIDFWLNAFGPKGLKSYILDARLQELTDAVNQWVTVLTGGTIWVEFSTQKKTRSKKLVNSPTVRICRWNPDGTITERNFNSWSGGEKQRISFAIDFGLSRLIAQRAKKSYNLLILDEVFQHLDQGGKEAVMDMLQSLAQEKSSVFVVEHDTEFQSAFENRVIVRKKNRRSTIEELSNGQSDGIENEAKATGTTAKRETLPVKTVDRKRVIRTPI